mgnify:CR=1 FL=1
MDAGLCFISLVDIALRGHTAFRQGKMLGLHRRTSVVGKITGIVGTAVPFGETRGKNQRKDAERETDQQLFQITFPPHFAES